MPITVTSIAIKTIDQIGDNGIHAKLTNALTAARITPTVRAHTAPLNTPSPQAR